MTDALDAIRAHNTTSGGTCEAGMFLRQNPDLAETVEKAMDDPTIQGKAISRWLAREHNIKLGHYTINRHRRGDCGCE